MSSLPRAHTASHTSFTCLSPERPATDLKIENLMVLQLVHSGSSPSGVSMVHTDTIQGSQGAYWNHTGLSRRILEPHGVPKAHTGTIRGSQGAYWNHTGFPWRILEPYGADIWSFHSTYSGHHSYGGSHGAYWNHTSFHGAH